MMVADTTHPREERHVAYVGLGANLGDTQTTLHAAARALLQTPGIDHLEMSSFYRTAPVDSSGPDYLNAVARLRCTHGPYELLRILQRIETEHGRERPYHNAPRSLDLDLLLYDDLSLSDPILTLPHPRMHLRAFVLGPLQELAPELLLPQGNLRDLLAACMDQPITRLS